AARPKVSLLFAMLHPALAVSGTSAASTLYGTHKTPRTVGTVPCHLDGRQVLDGLCEENSACSFLGRGA
ncbi:MAG TPA: hypothetical protein VKE94_09450, partial [Gemmataceae bacterium]|nr:hypothetical protein [Gemmataceae bacterium]